MQMINLTQHIGTADQNVTEPADKGAVQELLTFDSLPSSAEIQKRAEALAEIAKGYSTAMIGGAPYLMGPLEKALFEVGVAPYYAFSERVSVEVEVDGVITKKTTFKHVGFVEVER